MSCQFTVGLRFNKKADRVVVDAEDALIAALKNVDTITSGETLYGIYYNPSTKQCIQLTNADDKVYAVNDIKTHPKCH